MMKSSLKITFGMAITLLMASCGSPGGQNGQESTDTLEHQASEASQVQLTPLDIPAIEKALGMKGEEKNGEYKVSVPQNDLKIMVDGFQIIPRSEEQPSELQSLMRNSN